MQSSVGQRALSTLASKLHPQLPLTPRECQQLLNLLTSSFRAHLDREHPVHVSEKTQKPNVRKASKRASSSYVLASQHIDAVLNNPLFTVNPTQAASPSTASDVLKDPMGWFLGQIATGNATLTKASICLEMLEKGTVVQTPMPRSDRKPGHIIGQWLHTSGLDASKEFLQMCTANPQAQWPAGTFVARLVTLLIADGENSLLWKWFRTERDHGSSGLTVAFKQQLLRHMVYVESNEDLCRGMATFLRAIKALELIGQDVVSRHHILKPAGWILVRSIMEKPTNNVLPALYDPFVGSTQLWRNGKWSPVVDAMLQLHHPTSASVSRALQFIQDPAGASTFANGVPGQRRFIVHLSLTVARQLMEEERFKDAQTVMAFAKKHLPEPVLSDLPTEHSQDAVRQMLQSNEITRKERKKEIFELLDSLVPV